MFGRALMGETVRRAGCATRSGCTATALLWHDAIRLDGPVQAVLDRAACAGGGRAVATLLLAHRTRRTALDALRAALAPFDGGASCWTGCWWRGWSRAMGPVHAPQSWQDWRCCGPAGRCPACGAAE